MKSRSRVKSHGEVFTPRHMVDRMLDLVREDLETGLEFVDKTFLEPAAGDGNFLVAILQRKLLAIRKRYSAEEQARESLFALASVYGIELLEDNHREAKTSMINEFLSFHQSCGLPCAPETNLYRAAAFIIETNIVRGDTLTGLDLHGEEIQFSWWHRTYDAPGFVLREPFTFTSLREENLFDFTEYARYAACPIDQVHEEVKAGA